MRSPRLLALLAICGLAFGACGGLPRMSDSAAADLASRVAAVRTAVAEGDREEALDALDGLYLAVTNLHERGEISDAKANTIVTAANDVKSSLGLIATTTSTSTTTIPVFDEDEFDEDRSGPGNGNGWGRGNGGGEDGDD